MRQSFEQDIVASPTLKRTNLGTGDFRRRILAALDVFRQLVEMCPLDGDPSLAELVPKSLQNPKDSMHAAVGPNKKTEKIRTKRTTKSKTAEAARKNCDKGTSQPRLVAEWECRTESTFAAR